MIHEKHMEWIEARGISVELASKLGLFTKRDGGGNWLVIPYVERDRTVNHKYRLASEKRHRMDTDAPLTLWNHDALLSQNDRPLIVTEGEWDGMAAMMAGFDRVVSVPNGAPSEVTDEPAEAKRYQFLWRSRDLLDKVSRFILAADADGPGRALASDLARLLGPERCMFVEYPEGCKDLNDVLLEQGPAGVTAVLNGAKPYPVKGLYRFDDFPPPPPVQAVHLTIGGLRELLPLTIGTFTVITGYAGMGKTSLLCFILADLLKQGVRMAVGSFETSPDIMQRKMRAALQGVGFDHHKARNPGPVDDMLNDRFLIIAQNCADEETEMDLDGLIELAKIAVLRDNVRLIVIDPWNEIEHRRQANENEHEYSGRAIRALKRFARTYQVAVWLVAHPKKPDGAELKAPGLYDVSGSAHFANKPDYGVSIHRPNLTQPAIEVKVSKVRMGMPGRVGKVILDYDEVTSSYHYTPTFSELEQAGA
jgi:twinkle protein